MKHSLTLSQADSTERYGLEVNLLSSDNLQSFQAIMAAPNASVVPSRSPYREDAEVVL